MGNGQTINWLEMANNGPLPATAAISIKDRDGNTIHSEMRIIPASGQSHLYLSALIDPAGTGNVGTASVSCLDPMDSLITQSAFYGKSFGNPDIEWSYTSQSLNSSGAKDGQTIALPANTFVGMANWVKLVNLSETANTANFKIFDQFGGTLKDEALPVNASATLDIDVHSSMAPSTVGSVSLEPSGVGAEVKAEILRVLPRTDGQIGGIVSIPASVNYGQDASFLGDPQSLAPYRNNISSDEAQHLYTHIAFGAPPETIDRAVRVGLEETTNDLLKTKSNAGINSQVSNYLDDDLEDSKSFSWRGIRKGWLHLLLNSANPLQEKMALVLHDLFATSCSPINSSSELRYCWTHIELLRKHSMGNFRNLMLEMNRDYAMLIWLNGALNRAEEPDENYAREHWELFSTGETFAEGGIYPRYTDEDIAEASRAFTGWTSEYIVDRRYRVWVPEFLRYRSENSMERYAI